MAGASRCYSSKPLNLDDVCNSGDGDPVSAFECTSARYRIGPTALILNLRRKLAETMEAAFLNQELLPYRRDSTTTGLLPKCGKFGRARCERDY
jgi:hypothetical protein